MHGTQGTTTLGRRASQRSRFLRHPNFKFTLEKKPPQKGGAVRTLCFDLANRRLEISSEFGHALMIAVIRLPIGGGWEKFIPPCTLAAPLLVQQCCKPQDRDESMKHRRR